jgi:hypothetical protein
MGFTKHRVLAPLVIALLFFACDRPDDQAGAATADSATSLTPAAEPAPAPVSGTLETEAQMDTEDARSYHARRASMASYTQCMAQAKQLEPGQDRKRIEAACARLPNAPH